MAKKWVWKEDLKEAEERLKAFWNHEPTDRPTMGFYYPLPDVPMGILDFWFLARNIDDFEGAV